MEFLIRGEKIKVTDSIKNYIEEKLGRLNKYFDAPDSIKATALIKVKDNEEIIEVTIPTTKFTLRAEEKNKDLYAAIDLVTDKLERQIRKNKTRLKAKYKKDNPQYFGETVVKKVQSSPAMAGGTQPQTTNDIMNNLLRSGRE